MASRSDMRRSRSDEDRSRSHPSKKLRGRSREANVYDAVAGRMTLQNAGQENVIPTLPSGLHSSRHARLPPEDVLFKRKNAPVRYVEKDFYWANDDLPDAGMHHLPASDLLKSIHGYASKFYEAMADRLGPRSATGSGMIDERSLDETALLSFGILLEEASREALGKRGDLVLVEPSESVDPQAGAVTFQREEPSESLRENMLPEIDRNSSQNKRPAKRRKVTRDDSLVESAT
ncbi:hypothetical protein B0T26DRAFT_748884 [Lasiosphaeria miniovina]|uniref:Uncharacterized protein n=1 Tax=Lasiosphaeria miniovina TaxID=1954250 RepID=A0AA40B6R4_9PEZI|nr:uncharacterized protein B0T26DRAFT_748884 [Lasiosphaeria miniovina]KAK0728713.1 hypothetical protein B0T26DRAFT_748884 [Lasiosphaeria miniovina]